ncbi:hypothetical protein OXX80_010146 [Metschnikowia pulcherrima]
MTPRQLRTKNQGVHKVLKGVSSNNIYARPKKGGHGLLEIKRRCKGTKSQCLSLPWVTQRIGIPNISV